MTRLGLAIVLLLCGIYAAAAQFNGCPPGFCSGMRGFGGSSGGGFSPNTNGGGGGGPNFRITNVPDFRITNTGDSRIIAP